MQKFNPKNKNHLIAKQRQDLGSRLRAQGKALSAKEGRRAENIYSALARLAEAGRFQVYGDAICIPISRVGDIVLAIMKGDK